MDTENEINIEVEILDVTGSCQREGNKKSMIPILIYDRLNNNLNSGEIYYCICGGYFSLVSWSKHKKSKKHTNHIKKIMEQIKHFEHIDKPRYFMIRKHNKTKKHGYFTVKFN